MVAMPVSTPCPLDALLFNKRSRGLVVSTRHSRLADFRLRWVEADPQISPLWGHGWRLSSVVKRLPLGLRRECGIGVAARQAAQGPLTATARSRASNGG